MSMNDEYRSINVAYSAHREALARVEAERDKLADKLGVRIGERDTAQAQLAEAVGLLSKVEAINDCEELMQIEAFVARHAQAEQQESQGAQAGDERAAFERNPNFIGMDFSRATNFPDYYDSPFANGAWQGWKARAALATQPAAGEPIGKVELFGINMTYVEWRDRKMPPLGTELYAAPPAAAHGDEVVRKDAERYRWLRSNCEDGDLCIARSDGFSLRSWSGDDPDRYIDAAMRAQGDGEVQ